jgi:hypothetical protein
MYHHFHRRQRQVNVTVHQKLLRQDVVPWIQRLYPDGNYVFQQNSAPAQTARTTQEFLRENLPEFWMLDLNSLDFSIRSI